jgi:hypothetical protein
MSKSLPKLAAMSLMYASLASMNEIPSEREPTKFDLPNNPKPPLPKGAKVWHAYGGVIAINEANAKRKFNKLNK